MQHRPEWRRFSSGMIKIAFTLSETNLFITFAIKFGEGTKQLFSSVQLALKASTHSVSGNLYFELNLTHCKPINCMNAQQFFIISNNFIIDWPIIHICQTTQSVSFFIFCLRLSTRIDSNIIFWARFKNVINNVLQIRYCQSVKF